MVSHPETGSDSPIESDRYWGRDSSSIWSCLSSAIVAPSALFVFLKLLSVLSHLVFARIRSESCFLCIKGFPVIKIHSD